MTTTLDAMLPLDQPRTIALSIGGHIYRYIFRRVTQKDWRSFYRAFRIESLRSQSEVVETFEYATALAAIVRDCVESVEGYRLDTEAVPHWREVLPPAHVNAAGLCLRDVAPQRRLATDPIEISALFEVRLVASWTANPDGSMTSYSDLVHRFRAPTLDEQRVFNRKVNTTRVIGDSRNGRTIYSEKQALEMEYYDLLIEEVEGYSVKDAPLTGSKQIAKEMDGCHKVAAINALLRAGDIDMEIAAPKPVTAEDNDESAEGEGDSAE